MIGQSDYFSFANMTLNRETHYYHPDAGNSIVTTDVLILLQGSPISIIRVYVNNDTKTLAHLKYFVITEAVQ